MGPGYSLRPHFFWMTSPKGEDSVFDMIVLFTDFGVADPYVGQLHAVFAREAPGIPVIDLFHAVPNFDVRHGAYLLPAYASEFPPNAVFVCVIDPGVGGERHPVMLRADDRWYVGPDNGLLSMLARRSRVAQGFLIRWRPERLSGSFHGRDLFAPVAARLARGELPEHEPFALTVPDWPDDLAQVLYVDHYGNAITGLRGTAVAADHSLRVGRRTLAYARVYSEVPRGRAFWYINSSGLVEIAVREDSAARRLRLRPGTPVRPLIQAGRVTRSGRPRRRS
jgi:S-adenosylmethionine hydrolase